MSRILTAQIASAALLACVSLIGAAPLADGQTAASPQGAGLAVPGTAVRSAAGIGSGTAVIDAAPVPAAMAVALDGALEDEAWARATPVIAFVQRDPKEGAAPSQPTEVRVLYDREFLYIARPRLRHRAARALSASARGAIRDRPRTGFAS